MRDLTQSHLDGISATFVLLGKQLEALGQHVATLKAEAEKQTAPRVSVELPRRCDGIAAHRCAMQEPDAKLPRASFSNPGGYRCAGCGHEE